MTSIAINLTIIIGIILILIALWEAIFWTILGKPVRQSKEASDWLDYNVRLNTVDPSMIYKPFVTKPGYILHINTVDPSIIYKPFVTKPGYILHIKIHKPSLFSKYYVETTDGEFRVLRGTELHRKIERKFDRLIKIRNKYTF